MNLKNLLPKKWRTPAVRTPAVKNVWDPSAQTAWPTIDDPKSDESEMMYVAEPFLEWFFELRDPKEILVAPLEMDRKTAIAYIKGEVLKLASQRGITLTDEQRKFIILNVLEDAGSRQMAPDFKRKSQTP
jgi:hypothetical protein